MSGGRITRRSFLDIAGKTLALAGVGAGALGPHPARAQGRQALSSEEAQSLLAMARRLYPHDRLGDQYYWVAVNGIDAEMAASAALRREVEEGLARLDAAFGLPFHALSEGNQLQALRAVEGTPFFSDVLNKTSFYFYNNKKVWRHFGYEGSSFELGGYLERGFDDIGWLRPA
jgi:hypothetical protein